MCVMLTEQTSKSDKVSQTIDEVKVGQLENTENHPKYNKN